MIIDIIDKVEREIKYLSESTLQFSKLYNETGKRKYGELMKNINLPYINCIGF